MTLMSLQVMPWVGECADLSNDMQDQDLGHPPDVTHLKDVEQQQEQQEPAPV